jgi:hypothetical protein
MPLLGHINMTEQLEVRVGQGVCYRRSATPPEVWAEFIRRRRALAGVVCREIQAKLDAAYAAYPHFRFDEGDAMENLTHHKFDDIWPQIVGVGDGADGWFAITGSGFTSIDDDDVEQTNRRTKTHSRCVLVEHRDGVLPRDSLAARVDAVALELRVPRLSGTLLVVYRPPATYA